MPQLKSYVAKLDDVDEKYRDLYVESKSDGADAADGFVLDVDGKDYKAKLDEFRNNNIRLRQDSEKLVEAAKRFDGIDPDKYREYKEKAESIDDKELLDKGKVDELVAKRIEALNTEHKSQLDALNKKVVEVTEESDKRKRKLSELLVNDALTKSVGEIGKLQPGALQDIQNRARAVWHVEDDGSIVAKSPEGNHLYGADGITKITMKEWMDGQAKDSPYLFMQNTGGGSGGGASEEGGSGGSIANDPDALSRHLEDVASGKMRVA